MKTMTEGIRDSRFIFIKELAADQGLSEKYVQNNYRLRFPELKPVKLYANQKRIKFWRKDYERLCSQPK